MWTCENIMVRPTLLSELIVTLTIVWLACEINQELCTFMWFWLLVRMNQCSLVDLENQGVSEWHSVNSRSRELATGLWEWQPPGRHIAVTGIRPSVRHALLACQKICLKKKIIINCTRPIVSMQPSVQRLRTSLTTTSLLGTTYVICGNY